MNRKKFVQTSCLGIGAAITPYFASCMEVFEKETTLTQLNPKIIKNNKGETLNVLGDIQTHKLVGSETDNQIVEWVDDVEPGVGIPPHIHSREDEIFRVIQGEIEIMVGGNTTILEAGDTAFAPKNIAHSWTVVGTKKAKMITSAFPAGIEVMFRELADLPSGPPDFEKVTQICENHGVSFEK